MGETFTKGHTDVASFLYRVLLHSRRELPHSAAGGVKEERPVTVKTSTVDKTSTQYLRIKYSDHHSENDFFFLAGE